MPTRGQPLMWCLAAALGTVVVAGCEAADESAVGSDGASCNGGKCDDADGDVTEGDFEFIVVGSGAGGGPLAANLARQGHRVLLLEAGQDMGDEDVYQVPAFHAQSTEHPGMAWDYFVDHYDDEEQALRDSKMAFDEDGNPKGIFYPRAGTLGGCTAHNAMITVKPHDSDWDTLALLTGDDSWSAERMDPYWGRVTGWLETERPDPTLLLFGFRLQQIVMAAGMKSLPGFFQSVGQLFGVLSHDVNKENASREGLYTFPQAIANKRRVGTREYLVDTVNQGFPLTIQTGALVTNVVFADEPDEDGELRAIGVEFMLGDHLYEADPSADPEHEDPPEKRFVPAGREVILSAGSFNTPQLLKLSGVGPREELEELGQDVRVELPGVGQNLQDRYEVGLVSTIDHKFRLLKDCTFTGSEDDICFEKWTRGKGPYGTNGVVAAILRRTSDDEPDPNVFIFGMPANFRGYYPGYSRDVAADASHFTWAILQGHTQNRGGTVQLRSLDPRQMPHINFHYFDEGTNDEGQADHDLDAMVEAVEHAREIQGLANFFMIFDDMEEQVPGQDVESREEIAQWVKDEAWGHHACCTAKMGDDADPTAVLNSRFEVRGTNGLRVVDASVFPRIPGLFIAAPIYMASERATDIILEDMGETRIEENFP